MQKQRRIKALARFEALKKEYEVQLSDLRAKRKQLKALKQATPDDCDLCDRDIAFWEDKLQKIDETIKNTRRKL